jgi:hypothetical protein
LRVKNPKVWVKKRAPSTGPAANLAKQFLGGSGLAGWGFSKGLSPGMDGAARDTEELEFPYIQEAWIAAAVDFRAMVHALCRPRIWDRDPDLDGAQEIVDGPVHALLNQPTPGMDWLTWRIQDSVYMDLFNESFHWLLDSEGRPLKPFGEGPEALIELPAEMISVKGTAVDLDLDDVGRVGRWRVGGYHGQISAEPGAVVVHGRTPDPYRPYRFLGPVAKSWGSTARRYLGNRFSENLMRNGGEPGGIVTVPGNLSNPEVEFLRSQLAEEWGDPENAGDWQLLHGDAKVERGRSSPRDLEWPTVHDLSKEDISAVFGVSGSLLGKKDENFATFQGHWKMFVETQAIPCFRQDERQWRGMFQRMRDPAFRNIYIRYDTEILDSVFATLEEKGDNARKFYGMGIPLNESIRQAGMKVDPIEGGDIPMADQGVQPLMAAIAAGRALAASALQAAGASGQDSFNEVGLGHLTYEEPPEPVGDVEVVPNSSHSADHDEEAQDRGVAATALKAAPDAGGQEERKQVEDLKRPIAKRLDGSLKRVFFQMMKAQKAALQAASRGESPELCFDFHKSMVKGVNRKYISIYDSDLDIDDKGIDGVERLLALDMEEGDGRKRIEGLRSSYKNAPAQQIEDAVGLRKADLSEVQVAWLVQVTEAQWVDVIASRIEAAALEAYDLAMDQLEKKWGESLDDEEARLFAGIVIRSHAINVSEGTVRVIARKMRSDLIRIVSAESGDAATVSAALAASLQSLESSIDASLKKHQQRAVSIAMTEVSVAASLARSDGLKVLADLGKSDGNEWVTTLGPDVRDSHSAMHGQRRRAGEFFLSGAGNSLKRPHDSSAPAEEVVNCQCILRAIPKE